MIYPKRPPKMDGTITKKCKFPFAPLVCSVYEMQCWTVFCKKKGPMLQVVDIILDRDSM